ncbi:MAG TPA: hypothetical protein VFM99_04370 [Chitinophagales bacterium]|nr:hypothetical protein [Chitinophagales bacterium]
MLTTAIFVKSLDTQLKHLLIIVTLTGIFLQNFTSEIFLAGFELNREYIATNLCEQKDITNNNCQGSCFIINQIDKQSNTEQTPLSKNIKEVKDFQLFCLQLFSIQMHSSSSGQLFALPYIFSLPTTPDIIFLHPPSA